jgi:predicted small secreted protein
MSRKLITLTVMGASLAISGCNMVRGAARDVESVATCTEDMIKRGECRR